VNTKLPQICHRCRKLKVPELGRFIWVKGRNTPLFVCANCDSRRFKRHRAVKPSPLELRARRALMAQTLPFEEQKRFGPWFFDFAVPALGLMIEVDGRTYHRHQRRARDWAKAREARKAGWEVRHLGPDDLEGELDAALEQRAEEVGVVRRMKAKDVLNRIVEDAGAALDEFTRAYVIAALWSSTDESDPSGGKPMDEKYTIRDIAPETLAKMAEDCRNFQAQHGIPHYGHGQYTDEELAGHDFWLTRNGHGAGFWDRDELGEADREKYTNAAHAFGSFDLYVGDDGKIYGS
jgi:very-short-patch-repair endonuclease